MLPWQLNGENVVNPTRTFQTKQMFLSLKRVENVLITTSEDNKLRIWGLGEQRLGDLVLAKTWQSHQRGVPTSISNFQNLLYTSCARDNSIRTWDLLTLERGPDFEGHTNPVTDVATDKHIKTPLLWSGSMDKTVKAWDGLNGKCIATLEGHTEGITTLKVTGNSVVSASTDKTVRIWDKRKMQSISVLQGHTAAVGGVRVYHDKTIFSFGKDGTVHSWKLKNGELKVKFETGYPIEKLKLTKKYISTMGAEALEIYTKKGKKVHTLQGHNNSITANKFYDEEYIFSGSADRTVRLWSVKSGEQMAVYRGHHSTVSGIQFWGGWIYTAGQDSTLRQWKNEVFEAMDEGVRWI